VRAPKLGARVPHRHQALVLSQVLQDHLFKTIATTPSKSPKIIH